MNITIAFKQTVLTLMISAMIFIMIQVAMAQLLSSTLLTAVDSNTSLIVIVFIGFLVAFLVALVVNLIVSEKIQQKKTLAASLFAMATSFVILVCVSYISVVHTYPDVIAVPSESNLLMEIITRAGYYLVAIPRILGYFAIYIVGDLNLFFFLEIILYSMSYMLFLLLN